MKKINIFILLSFIVVTMTTIPAIEFIDQADAEVFWAVESIKMGAILDRAKKAIADNDDVALKEAIFEISYNAIGYAGISVVYFRGFLSDDVHGIPPERVKKVLHDTIRKSLPNLFDKDENKRLCAQHDVWVAVEFLKALPSADTIVLLKECIQSKDENIRNVATKSYNAIMEKTQNQPQPNEMAQLISKTPFSQTLKISSRKPFLWLVVFSFFAIIGGVVVWKKIKPLGDSHVK